MLKEGRAAETKFMNMDELPARELTRPVPISLHHPDGMLTSLFA